MTVGVTVGVGVGLAVTVGVIVGVPEGVVRVTVGVIVGLIKEPPPECLRERTGPTRKPPWPPDDRPGAAALAERKASPPPACALP